MYVTKLPNLHMVLMLPSVVVHSDALALTVSVGPLGQVWFIVCCSLFYYYTPLTAIPLAVSEPEVHVRVAYAAQQP